jgi:hypothetical protein
MTEAQESQQDVVDLLTAQHRRISTLLEQLKAGHDGKQERFTELVRLLAVHESAEEEVVHPRASRARFDADEIVEPRLEEENEAKRALSELYDLGVDHPDFNRKLSAFADAVAAHSANEEAQEFVLLRKQYSGEQLRRDRYGRPKRGPRPAHILAPVNQRWPTSSPDHRWRCSTVLATLCATGAAINHR